MIPGPPPAALAVAPARLSLAGGDSAQVEIRNPGSGRIAVLALVARYALDADGRPRVVARGGRVRLLVRPAAVVLPAGGTAHVLVTAQVERGARPGDHAELLVLATRPVARGGVGVRLRVGVPVLVHAAGAIVRRLVVQSIAVLRFGRAAAIGVVVRNRGNVAERLTPTTLDVRLVRAGRVVARLTAGRREVLPGARTVLRLGCPRRAHGRFRLVVRIGGMPAGSRSLELP